MKILIVHASAGAGHTKAAEALQNEFAKVPGWNVTLVDSLDYTSPFNKYLYCKSYTLMVTRWPKLWGVVFALLDLPQMQSVMRIGRHVFNGLTAKRFERYLRAEQFDYIVSTHFLANEVAARLKRAGKISSKIIGVITDFDVHRIWLQPGIDHYAVATDDTKQKTLELGIPSSAVTVTGIPIHEKFQKKEDKAALQQKFGLSPGVLSALMATGSFGMGPIKEMVRSLSAFQIMVVCGHNKELYNTLTTEAIPKAHVFGLVNNMQELMSAADVMITKPGGLSISEALSKGLPMIFFSAIPGQETNNIKVLAKYGIGLEGEGPKHIAAELNRLNNPEVLNSARQKVLKLSRPQAAQAIKELIR